MKKKTAYYISLLVFFTALGFGQKLPLQVYTTEHGLISNFISALHQDSKGYLWIGTDEGFSIFDGKEFANYSFGEKNIWGQVNGFLESKIEKDVMWIATNGAGLVKFSNSEMKNFRIGANINSNRLNTMYQDSLGVLWCGTDDGLYLWNNGNAKKDTIAILQKPIISIQQDDLGILWMSSENGLLMYNRKNNSVSRFDTTIIRSLSIFGLTKFSDGSIVFTSADGKIYFIKNGKLVKAVSQPSRQTVFPIESENGTYYLSTNDGLEKFKIADTTDIMLRIYSTSNGLPVNGFSVGTRDKENNLWFGSYGKGLTKLEPSEIIQFTFHGMTALAASDSSGHIWVPCAYGVYEIFYVENHWEKFLHPVAGFRFPVQPVAAAIDKQQNLWITASNGEIQQLIIERRSEKESMIKTGAKLSVQNNFPLALPISLFIDSRNFLWYYHRDNSLVVVDINDKAKIRQQIFNPDSIRFRDIRNISEDRNGRVWALGYEEGMLVYEFDGKNYKECNPEQKMLLPNIAFRSMIQSNDGAMWFGSRYEGLYEVRNSTVNHYAATSGMFSNQIWELRETKNSRLLLGTQAGFGISLNADKKKFKYIPYITQSPLRSIGIIGDTTVWAATGFEITIFDLRQIVIEAAPLPVYLKQIVVNGKVYNNFSKHSFSYGENTITFDFSAITFSSPGAIRYQFKLEPIENQWREPVTNRSVTYAGLRPGKYFFSVQAINENGIASPIPASVEFSIASPFWQRWWFIGFVMICLAGILFTAERFRVRRLLEIEKIRSRIAADLHDDIGSGLTRIALLSELIQRQAGVSENTESSQFSISSLTEKVGGISRELVDAMSDVVWSIDPKNSSMEKLIFRISAFSTELCEAKDIRFHSFVSPELEKLTTDSQVLRTALLVAKEAVNNVVRHSQATELKFSLTADKNFLLLEIIDNGKGFIVNDLARMNGLTNMRVRVEKSGGKFEIISSIEQGTTIRAYIPHR